MASTSITVTVMVPVKSLLLVAWPAPSKVFADLPDPERPENDANGMTLMGPTWAEASEARLNLLEPFLLAAVFSLIWTISVSPTLRARTSSNSGR